MVHLIISSHNLTYLYRCQVVVGKPLYEIDTDGVPTAVAAAPLSSPTKEASSSKSTGNVESKSSSHRTPLIKFVGKRSKHSQPITVTPVATGNVPASKPAPTPVAQKKHHPNSVDFFTMPNKAWYGRPRLSEKEIQAIESGGAV